LSLAGSGSLRPTSTTASGTGFPPGSVTRPATGTPEWSVSVAVPSRSLAVVAPDGRWVCPQVTSDTKSGWASRSVRGTSSAGTLATCHRPSASVTAGRSFDASNPL
jgi:hypothetical protein